MSRNHTQRAVLPFSRSRRAAQDLSVAQRKHLIHGLIEADVTEARTLLREYQAATGTALSFTAFIIACVARATDEQKTIQVYRMGRRHLVVFDDVDVTTMIEREVDGRTQVVFHIVRAANTKSVLDIHQEIREAQTRRSGGLQQMGVRIFTALPGTIRRMGIRIAAHNPDLWKRFGGTVVVTAVGMFGKGGGWGIPTTCNTLDVTIGGIAEKPRLRDGHVVQREFLSITVSVDHDVVDGAPAARFASRLRELIERAYGLTQLIQISHGADSSQTSKEAAGAVTTP